MPIREKARALSIRISIAPAASTIGGPTSGSRRRASSRSVSHSPAQREMQEWIEANPALVYLNSEDGLQPVEQDSDEVIEEAEIWGLTYLTHPGGTVEIRLHMNRFRSQDVYSG
jgi:hypothetical protein